MCLGVCELVPAWSAEIRNLGKFIRSRNTETQPNISVNCLHILVGKLLSNRVERIWNFPSAQIPFWNRYHFELIWTERSMYTYSKERWSLSCERYTQLPSSTSSAARENAASSAKSRNLYRIGTSLKHVLRRQRHVRTADCRAVSYKHNFKTPLTTS